ncbi:MAG: hypothetical protein N4A33_13525 [Bacteriovoracaceae bacterium]|nr:hypothetical protein [Bacteriovoracaceae bacterium]
MKKILVGVLALGAMSSFAKTIEHSTCNVGKLSYIGEDSARDSIIETLERKGYSILEEETNADLRISFGLQMQLGIAGVQRVMGNKFQNKMADIKERYQELTKNTYKYVMVEEVKSARYEGMGVVLDTEVLFLKERIGFQVLMSKDHDKLRAKAVDWSLEKMPNCVQK